MSEAAPKKLKIFVHSADAIGHLNACIGMAQSLAKRGHQIIFLCSEKFKGKFTKYGFEELHLIEASKPAAPKPAAAAGDASSPPEHPAKKLALGLKASGLLSAKSPLEKLKMGNNASNVFDHIWQGLVDFTPQIAEAIRREKPDVFVYDHFFVSPALPQSGVPWVKLFSGCPLGLYKSDKLPPFGGGFPTSTDPAEWQEFKKLQDEKRTFKDYQKKINEHFGYKPEGASDDFFDTPQYLGIYGYPAELDYNDIVPRPAKWAAVDAFSFEIPEPFELPAGFVQPGEKLVYVSLGSMGSVDVDLMKRITSVLGKTAHKYIVSKGPLAEEYELPANMWGQAFLPQTRILPLVDAVITHGGNNTITETFSFGKPLLVLPLFADQYDNAQRVTEKGYGARLETYAFTEEELISTINRLLNDSEMIARAKAAAKRIETSKSKEKVCKQIEEIVEQAKAGVL